MRHSRHHMGLAEDTCDEAAPIHWRTTQRMIEEIVDPAATYLHDVHAGELRRLGVAGSAVAQLDCNNGRELISIARLGAGPTTGFDISESFISQARQLAAAAAVACDFVQSDACRIPHAYDSRYDLIVVTAGALCFMPELPGYIAVAKRLLKPGGALSIYESHPITDMFLPDRDRGGRPLELVRSYFETHPAEHRTGLDSITGSTCAAKPVCCFHHKLSDIITACLDAGLAIERFLEHDQDPSQAFRQVEAMAEKPPLSFLLTARAGGPRNAPNAHPGRQATAVGA